MKTCSKCKVEKDPSEFNKHSKRKDGLQTNCKTCNAARSKQYYAENQSKHLAVVMARKEAEREKARLLICDLLSNNSCKDCGEDDILVLEFDHLPQYEKSYNVASMVAGGYSAKAISAEIAKCEIVCANCHKRRTYGRMDNYRSRHAALAQLGRARSF